MSTILRVLGIERDRTLIGYELPINPFCVMKAVFSTCGMITVRPSSLFFVQGHFWLQSLSSVKCRREAERKMNVAHLAGYVVYLKIVPMRRFQAIL